VTAWLAAVDLCLYVLLPALVLYVLLSLLEWAVERWFEWYYRDDEG
jgi:hypothetical protein